MVNIVTHSGKCSESPKIKSPGASIDDRRLHSMDSFVQRIQGIAIGGKYHLIRKLGSGSFGHVYLGMATSLTPMACTDISRSTGRGAESGTEVAMKLENHKVVMALWIGMIRGSGDFPASPQQDDEEKLERSSKSDLNCIAVSPLTRATLTSNFINLRDVSAIDLPCPPGASLFALSPRSLLGNFPETSN